MKTHLFKLKCLTDLHVGNGEANYSIIDNEVQKDTVLTDVPIIHASGVKGALKEHFEQLWGKEDNRIKTIFGDKDGAGSYKFFSANLIARPLRVSDGDRPYILTTAKDILESFSSLLEGVGLSDFYKYQELQFKDGINFLSSVSGIEIEGSGSSLIDSTLGTGIDKLIEKEFAIANSLREYDLPARARNALKDGKSDNLWYEEVVPHKSIFYFVIITPGSSCDIVFEKGIPVQFGGNASIGNGYTEITEVSV